nr:hypothetical protein CFP56_32008 [Quercus suber]
MNKVVSTRIAYKIGNPLMVDAIKSGLARSSFLRIKNCSKKNSSSQSRIREEDDVDVHVFEEEEGDSSQNCHPLEVPPLA